MRGLGVAVALLAACGGTTTVDIDLVYDPDDTCQCAFDDVVFTQGADILIDVFNATELLTFGCGTGSTLDQLAADITQFDFSKFTEKEVALEVTIFSPPVFDDYDLCTIFSDPPFEILGDSPVVNLEERSVIPITMFCEQPLGATSCRTAN